MGKKKSAIGQQASRTPHIRGMQGGGIAQLPLSLGTLLGQNVTSVRMTALETARRRTLEAFRRAAVGFQFRHLNLLINSRFFLFRRKRHAQLSAFHLRKLLHHRVFNEIRFDSFQEVHPQFAVRQFPTAKPNGDFCLIAVRQKADETAQLDLVIALVRTRTELDFLDMNLLLLFLGRLQLFVLFETEFTIVHYPTDRRIGCRRNFDQI